MNNPSAFPLGEPNDGFAQYFDGQSWLAPVLDAPEVSIHNVTFEPGCRNHWHIHHHAAQILIAVGGRPSRSFQPFGVHDCGWHGRRDE